MPVIDIQEVMKLLPHRYPFLLVDRILECDDVKHVVGLKNVTINEPFFQGHFPGRPVMPGVLQIEAMAQTGGILIMRRFVGQALIPYFLSIDACRFRRVIQPGDAMRIEMEMTTLRSRVAKFRGRGLVGGQVASEADVLCMLTEAKDGA